MNKLNVLSIFFQRTSPDRNRHLPVVDHAWSKRAGRLTGHGPADPHQRGHSLAVQTAPGWSDETQG